MNFARFLTLIMFLGSLPLGWFAWVQYERNTELRANLEQGGDVEETVRQILKYSRQHTKLQSEVTDEGLKGQTNPNSYIQGIAIKKNVDIGLISVDPGTKDHKTYVDSTFRIKSNQKDSEFNRINLGNFFFSLENDSRRIRVTEIKMELKDRKTKPHDMPNDSWDFECTVTSRSKKGSS